MIIFSSCRRPTCLILTSIHSYPISIASPGDISRRLCSAAEVKFYFSNFFDKKSGNANYLKPNKNCNLTSWESGCEPGWACSTNQEVDLKDSQNMPSRTRDCQACCEGFFCPRGITCMIRKYKNIQDPLNGLCLVHGNLFNMLAFSVNAFSNFLKA